jgi:hypothetical protein
MLTFNNLKFNFTKKLKNYYHEEPLIFDNLKFLISQKNHKFLTTKKTVSLQTPKTIKFHHLKFQYHKKNVKFQYPKTISLQTLNNSNRNIPVLYSHLYHLTVRNHSRVEDQPRKHDKNVNGNHEGPDEPGSAVLV